MRYIVTNVEEHEVSAYVALCRSIRAHRTWRKISIVALFTDLTPESKRRLCGFVDDMACVKNFDSLRQLTATFGSNYGHSMTRLGAILLVREYLEKNARHRDTICALDASSILQRPPQQLFSQVLRGQVIFSRGIQLSHTAHNPNARLQVAELFDEPGAWLNPNYLDLNIGICVAKVSSFLRLVDNFAQFMLNCGYLDIYHDISEELVWDCQDFFRYYHRKTQREDISAFDIDRAFTTAGGGEKYLYFDTTESLYHTVWGETPLVIHFDPSESIARIPREPPWVNLRPSPVAIS